MHVGVGQDNLSNQIVTVIVAVLKCILITYIYFHVKYVLTGTTYLS